MSDTREGAAMTDLSLRERLAATICSDNEDAAADRCIDVLERWLSDNGLAIVPVKATGEMLNAAQVATGIGAGMSWVNLTPQKIHEWAHDAMVKAAPPAADLLRGKTNEPGAQDQ